MKLKRRRPSTGRRTRGSSRPHPLTEVAVECGWGRLLFAQTFSNERLVAELQAEQPGRRDIAFALQDPHVALALAPQELFLDPSHTLRLWLERYRPELPNPPGFVIRRVRDAEEAAQINRIYASRSMVPTDPDFLVANRLSRTLIPLVAVDRQSGAVIGTATGLDHHHAFADPENGSSLWCLAVDPQTPYPGVGEALVRHLAASFLARGRQFMDLSVMYDNRQALALYEKLGFVRVPVFSLKRKNPVNERLFIGPEPDQGLNPYARIIVDEARRRGISVDVLDADGGYFALGFGGRSVVCRESLSELTSAVAMSRCDDKAVTRRVLLRAGLSVPDQCVVTGRDEADAFLARHGQVVVKPARGEQGAGISVDIRSPDDLTAAIGRAQEVCDRVLLEEYVSGQDLRIVVIGFRVAAAAVRRPARIVGDGLRTVAELIDRQSRRRMAATGGESSIPVDAETHRCLQAAGWTTEDVLPVGQALEVRKTANLHTGGTIHDVTADLHPDLAEAAVRAARALDIPVVGLDFLVPLVSGPEYAIIEANERPGLANHEPQPTAELFVDLLFPQTIPAS